MRYSNNIHCCPLLDPSGPKMPNPDLLERRCGRRDIIYQAIKKENWNTIKVLSFRKTLCNICTAYTVEQIQKCLGAPEKQRVVEKWDRFIREVVESPHLERFNTKIRHSPEPSAVVGPTLSRGTSRGHFWTFWFCERAIKENWTCIQHLIFGQKYKPCAGLSKGWEGCC